MRLSEYYGIQEAIKADVLQSEESYLKLLKVVGSNQRYNFENQLSIYYLCPQATACADFEEPSCVGKREYRFLMSMQAIKGCDISLMYHKRLP